MAVAAPIDPFWLARRESEYHPQKIPKSTTGLDEEGARNCVALLLAGQEAGICMCTSPPTRRCDSAWARCGDSTPTTERTPVCTSSFPLHSLTPPSLLHISCFPRHQAPHTFLSLVNALALPPKSDTRCSRPRVCGPPNQRNLRWS
jgi:hypothetical protein